MPGGALLHELGEHSRLVGLLPLRRQLLEHAVPHRTAPPIGNDLLLVEPHGLLVHAIPGLGPRVQDAQVLHAMAGQFGERGRRLRTRPALPDNQLILAQVDRLVLAEVMKCLSAHHRHRIAALVGLVKLGHQPGALAGNRRRRIETLTAELAGAVVHIQSIIVARAGYPHPARPISLLRYYPHLTDDFKAHPPVLTANPTLVKMSTARFIASAEGGCTSARPLSWPRRRAFGRPVR